MAWRRKAAVKGWIEIDCDYDDDDNDDG